MGGGTAGGQGLLLCADLPWGVELWDDLDADLETAWTAEHEEPVYAVARAGRCVAAAAGGAVFLHDCATGSPELFLQSMRLHHLQNLLTTCL